MTLTLASGQECINTLCSPIIVFQCDNFYTSSLMFAMQLLLTLQKTCINIPLQCEFSVNILDHVYYRLSVG